LSNAYIEQNNLWTDEDLYNLETEKNFRKTFVNRMKEEIAKEEAEVKEFADRNDENLDVRQAEGTAVVAWFKNILNEQ